MCLVLTFKNCTVQLTCSIFVFDAQHNATIYEYYFLNLFLSFLQTIEDCATKECLLDSSKSVFVLSLCSKTMPNGFTNDDNDDDDGRTLKTMVCNSHFSLSPLIFL